LEGRNAFISLIAAGITIADNVYRLTTKTNLNYSTPYLKVRFEILALHLLSLHIKAKTSFYSIEVLNGLVDSKG
jgi:hypothetical protein